MHGLAQRKWIYYTVCGWSSRSQNAVCYVHCIYSAIHVLMTDEKEDERGKQGQTNNKAKQHSTPKAVPFPKEK